MLSEQDKALRAARDHLQSLVDRGGIECASRWPEVAGSLRVVLDAARAEGSPSPGQGVSDAMVEAAALAMGREDHGHGDPEAVFLSWFPSSADMPAYRKTARLALTAALAQGGESRQGEEPVAWRARTARHDGSWGSWWIAQERPHEDVYDGGYGAEVEPLFARPSLPAAGEGE